MPNINERVADGRVVILDGGVGSEIERRGLDVDANAWAGAAQVLAPDLVRQVHIDYIRAGAEVITTNTFPSARHILETTAFGDQVEEINRTAVRIAKEARDQAADTPVWIAGAMSSMAPLAGSRARPTGPRVAENYREQAHLLADEGVDLLICEMMLDHDNSRLVVDAAKSTGLPVWIGASALRRRADEDLLVYREDDTGTWTLPVERFEDRIRDLMTLGGDVMGVMHSSPTDTDPGIEILKTYWDGPIMAYAETGHFEPPNYVFHEDVTPENYAKAAARWRALGTNIIGGCCGTGPEHIAALTEAMTVGPAAATAS